MSRTADNVKYCEECDTYYTAACNCIDQDTSDIPEDLIEMLLIVRGLPPHDSWSNICRGDGYYWHSIQNRYPEDLIRKAVKTVIEPLEQKLADAKAAVMEQYKKELK